LGYILLSWASWLDLHLLGIAFHSETHRQSIKTINFPLSLSQKSFKTKKTTLPLFFNTQNKSAKPYRHFLKQFHKMKPKVSSNSETSCEACTWVGFVLGSRSDKLHLPFKKCSTSNLLKKNSSFSKLTWHYCWTFSPLSTMN
jgi:hypothetical protein